MAGPHPDTIVTEIMTVCDLKCPTCRVMDTKEKPWLMPFEQFEVLARRIRPLIERARIINFCSSEPLMHKRVFDMVDLLKSYNLNLIPTWITNGMLLDGEAAENLLSRGINAICVSFDGATKETHEKIRVGSDFESVKENTRGFIKKGGHVRTIIVIQKDNIHELLDYVDMCAELGIWLIKISGLNTYRPEHVKECLYSREGIPWVDDLIRRALHKAWSYGIHMKVMPTKIWNEGCGLAGTMYIGKDGDVSPCVFFSEPYQLSLFEKTRTTEVIKWGNVYTDDPEEIWQSEPSVRFRGDIANQPACECCGLKYGVVC